MQTIVVPGPRVRKGTKMPRQWQLPSCAKVRYPRNSYFSLVAEPRRIKTFPADQMPNFVNLNVFAVLELVGYKWWKICRYDFRI